MLSNETATENPLFRKFYFLNHIQKIYLRKILVVNKTSAEATAAMDHVRK